MARPQAMCLVPVRMLVLHGLTKGWTVRWLDGVWEQPVLLIGASRGPENRRLMSVLLQDTLENNC